MWLDVTSDRSICQGCKLHGGKNGEKPCQNGEIHTLSGQTDSQNGEIHCLANSLHTLSGQTDSQNGEMNSLFGKQFAYPQWPNR